MSSFNITINHKNTGNKIDLVRLYNKITLDANITKKAYWNVGAKFKEYQNLVGGSEPKYFKNVLSLTWNKNDKNIPIKISAAGKIMIAHVPIEEMLSVERDILKRINDTGITLAKTGSSINSIQDTVLFPNVNVVNLDQLDKELSRLNLASYSFIKAKLSFISFKYYIDGFKSSTMIFGKGKFVNHISIDTSNESNIPNEMRAIIANYVVTMVMPFLKTASTMNLLDDCGNGKILVQTAKGIRCKKPTKAEVDKLFTGIVGQYNGFDSFSFNALKSTVQTITNPIENQAQATTKTRKKFLGNIPELCLHFPILESDSRKDWSVYGIPAGYQRMRFYVDATSKTFFIDHNNNYFESNYQITNEHDVVLDGYYSHKHNFFSPIDIIVHRAKLVHSLSYHERQKLMGNIAKKYNMHSTILPLSNFKQLRLNTLSGLVFVSKGPYYDPQFSWNEIRSTLGIYHGGSIVVGSAILPGFSGYRNGDTVEIRVENSTIQIIGKVNGQIRDAEYCERTLNSLLHITDISKLIIS